MEIALAFIAYGLLLLSGAFMTYFWGRLAIKRMYEIGWDWLYDRYSLITTYLSMSAIGTTIFFAGRSYAFMTSRQTIIPVGGVLPIVILTGLYILTIAKVGFIWALKMSHRAVVWLVFMALAFLWVVIALAWVWGDPFITHPHGGHNVNTINGESHVKG